jgi:uncharacterized protein YndB with AHSA1/START domain
MNLTKGTTGEARIEVDAPPEVVYDLVSDISRIAEWSPECVGARWLDGHSNAVLEARFRATNRNGIVRWSNSCRVISAEPGRQFAFVAPDPLGRPTTKWTYRLEPAGTGTSLTESFEMLRDLPIYVRVVERFVLGMKDRPALLEANLRTSLRAIKMLVERDQGGASKDLTEAGPHNEPVGLEDCSECGFKASAVSQNNAEETIRSLGHRYEKALALRSGCPAEPPDPWLRTQPEPGTWSVLEYTAHMRDVVALWGWGLHRTLKDEIPELPSDDPGLPDRVATETDYNGQDPATVVHELSANAERMADKVATITSEQWLHRAHFGEAEITPLWIVQKVAHEGHHHLLDIEKGLRATSDRFGRSRSD